LFSLVAVLFGAFIINDGYAQDLAPGKLVQIRQSPKYPFAPLSLDSLIGREYILLTDTILGAKFPKAPNFMGKRRIRLGRDSSRLANMFYDQPDQDSLLAPWYGKSFRIIDAEQDTSFGGILKNWYLDVKFNDSVSMVLDATTDDLQVGGSKLISKNVLDSARKRWEGKYLWMNIESTETNFPPLTRVKVLRIGPTMSFNGPFAFHIVSDKGNTAIIHVKLQQPDTSKFSIEFGTPFGKEFQDGPPNAFWKTVPSPGFEHDGIFFGEDSSIFFKNIKNLGVKIHSYKMTFSNTGDESSSTVELHGKGVWGMPFDTCIASFESEKLDGIAFWIYDSTEESSVRSDLAHKFGNPSQSDTVKGKLGMEDMVMQTWFYYSRDDHLQIISLLDAGDLSHAFDVLTKVFAKDGPVIPMLRSMLFYGEAGKEDSIVH
jgi:hypothetical protein